MQSIATVRLVALVAITGDHASAMVLNQIMYWHSGRLQVMRKGTLWLAKSRAEMCAETGITLDQYKRIMPLLAKQGWIVQERGLFKNKVTPHIQLTPAGYALFKTATQQVSKANGPLVGQSANLSTEITAKNTTEDLGHSGASTAEGGKLDPGEHSGEQGQEPDQDPDQKGWMMKASEILKNHTAPTTGSLGGYWKSRMAMLQEGYQKPLTGKELGQLKQLFKYLGDQTKPVIDYAVSHWWKFASQAAASAGVSFPADPHIGFLLQHHAVAVNLLTKGGVSPSVPVEIPVSPNDTPSVTGETAHTLTSQELTELLDGLKSP